MFSKKCFLCLSDGDGQLHRCGDCKTAIYCSPICQEIHWKEGHKYECDTYHIGADVLELQGDESKERKGLKRKLEKEKVEQHGIRYKRKEIQKVDETLDEIYFAANLIRVPSTTREFGEFQFLANEWPEVTEQKKVSSKYDIKPRANGVLFELEGKQWDSVERYMAYKKWMSVGEEKYAEEMYAAETINGLLKVNTLTMFTKWYRWREAQLGNELEDTDREVRKMWNALLKNSWSLEVQKPILEIALKRKFDPIRNRNLFEALMSTGNTKLVLLDTTLKGADTILGQKISGVGNNLLGELLMQLRSRFERPSLEGLQENVLSGTGISTIEGLILTTPFPKEEAIVVGKGPLNFQYRQYIAGDGELSQTYKKSDIKVIEKFNVTLKDVRMAAAEAYDEIYEEGLDGIEEYEPRIGDVSRYPLDNVWIFTHATNAVHFADEEIYLEAYKSIIPEIARVTKWPSDDIE